MADQIKELIEKINQEGVQAAEEKARAIEAEARAQAETIVARAKAGAQKISDDAQEKIQRMEASSRETLEQAGRDLVLVLKQEIIDILARVIAADVSQAVSQEELAKIVASVIRECATAQTQQVVVYLSEQDKKKLEGHFTAKLKEEAKKGVELKAQDDIRAGFIISFDAGKSQFDFTDKALADYIGSSLKPSIAALLSQKQ